MIVSLYASSQGVPQVITKLGHFENSKLADSISLGSVVCPKELCSSPCRVRRAWEEAKKEVFL